MRGDGLRNTPTGSTAYALSVNGPIIHPKLSCFGLVPIASQALSSRPISIPADMEITVVIKTALALFFTAICRLLLSYKMEIE